MGYPEIRREPQAWPARWPINDGWHLAPKGRSTIPDLVLS